MHTDTLPLLAAEIMLGRHSHDALSGRRVFSTAKAVGVGRRRRPGAGGRGAVAMGRPCAAGMSASCPPIRWPVTAAGWRWPRRTAGAVGLAAAGHRRHVRVSRHAAAGRGRTDAGGRGRRPRAVVRQPGIDLDSHVHPALHGPPRRRLPGIGRQILLPQHSRLGHAALRLSFLYGTTGSTQLSVSAGVGRSGGRAGDASSRL